MTKNSKNAKIFPMPSLKDILNAKLDSRPKAMSCSNQPLPLPSAVETIESNETEPLETLELLDEDLFSLDNTDCQNLKLKFYFYYLLNHRKFIHFWQFTNFCSFFSISFPSLRTREEIPDSLLSALVIYNGRKMKEKGIQKSTGLFDLSISLNNIGFYLTTDEMLELADLIERST